MTLEQQMLFLFSALGAFNGLFLSIYFAFLSKRNQPTSYFLSALLLVLSIRIIKSIFFYFNPDLSQIFIQIGLSACVLIGPFLYIYTHAMILGTIKKYWFLHVFPALCVVVLLGILFPYRSYRSIWTAYIIKGIYLQWLAYIIFTGISLKEIFSKLFSGQKKLSNTEIWVLSIFVGVTIIWAGYNVGSYTSYIVGAFSASFVFYLIILFMALRKKGSIWITEENVKYENKKINEEEAKAISQRLKQLMDEKKLFKNPNLKLNMLAKELGVTSHYLSQFLNDNFGKSFSLFINELRIEEAKELMQTKKAYNLEAIGYECGFNSKSTFFTAFKKIVGCTPMSYKNQLALLDKM